MATSLYLTNRIVFLTIDSVPADRASFSVGITMTTVANDTFLEHFNPDFVYQHNEWFSFIIELDTVLTS